MQGFRSEKRTDRIIDGWAVDTAIFGFCMNFIELWTQLAPNSQSVTHPVYLAICRYYNLEIRLYIWNILITSGLPYGTNTAKLTLVLEINYRQDSLVTSDFQKSDEIYGASSWLSNVASRWKKTLVIKNNFLFSSNMITNNIMGYFLIIICTSPKVSSG